MNWRTRGTRWIPAAIRLFQAVALFLRSKAQPERRAPAACFDLPETACETHGFDG
jgi:hypothetical protein